MAFTSGTISNTCKQMQKDGAAEGSANRPTSSATSPDMHEVQAITTAKLCIAAEEASFADALVGTERQSSEIAQRVEALEASCSSHLGHDLVESAFRSSLVKNEHNLVSSCAVEMEVRAALNGFKSRNEIKDPASYPEDALFHLSLLILFIVIETGVNAIFYEGSTGLLGGATVALGVSVMNMGVAALLGSLFRYANLPELKHKLVGYGSLLGFVLLGGLLNLIFATFRVQYQIMQIRIVDEGLSDASTPMLLGAFKSAFSDASSVFLFNFPPIDFMSFIMLFIGVGCSIMAFWKGYTIDDKHPGYGSMDRAHKKAEKAFRDAKDRSFAEAETEVRKMADDIEKLRDQIVSEQRNASALKAQAQSVHATFSSVVKTIQGELNLVIETYRAANRATRATSAPQYFADLPIVIPADDGGPRCESLLERIELVSVNAKMLADTRAQLLGDRLVQIRQKINELIEQEFHKQINAICKRAEASIESRGQLGS